MFERSTAAQLHLDLDKLANCYDGLECKKEVHDVRLKENGTWLDYRRWMDAGFARGWAVSAK